jgi:hypothetical protein
MVVRGIFPVNVPYLMPVAEFGPNEYYKILSPPSTASGGREAANSTNKAVMFKPHEYVGRGWWLSQLKSN